MKYALSMFTIAAVVLVPISAHARPAYYGTNLGGGTYLSWMFLDQVNEQGFNGYACVTRDALEGMASTANFERYAIIPPAHPEGGPTLHPLNGVVIYREGEQLVVDEGQPNPPSELFNYAPMNETGVWFDGDPDSVDEMGRACLDGGIAGSVRLLESWHGIDVPGF